MHALPRRHHPQRKRRRRNDICNGPTKQRSECRACRKHCYTLFGSLAVAAAAAAAGAGRSNQQSVRMMCAFARVREKAARSCSRTFVTFITQNRSCFCVIYN